MAGEEQYIRDVKKNVVKHLLNRVYNQQPVFHLELFISEASEEIIELFEELSITDKIAKEISEKFDGHLPKSNSL